jgi:hypothetical protein
LNAYAERWVKSVKDECLSKIILFGERSLRQALSEYVVRNLCNVAIGWVGSCVITIKKLRELAGKSRPMAVRLQLGAPLMPRLTHC